MLNQQKINRCVEALCSVGCESVQAVITAMEHDLFIQETAGLSKQERKVVLNELQSIMEVYNCRYTSPPQDTQTSHASDR